MGRWIRPRKMGSRRRSMTGRSWRLPLRSAGRKSGRTAAAARRWICCKPRRRRRKRRSSSCSTTASWRAGSRPRPRMGGFWHGAGGGPAAAAGGGGFRAGVGGPDGGAPAPLPLAAIIDGTVARAVSMGNINGSTYAFWRNQLSTSAATTWRGFFGECVGLYNDCSRGTGGSPDLIVDDQRTWEQYWNGL